LKKTEHHRWTKTVELMQIDVKDLRVGMYVSELDRPWLDTNFWFQGFEIKNQDDIDAVQSQCAFVYIDVSKQTKVTTFSSRSTSYSNDTLPSSPDYTSRRELKQQIKQTEILHRKTSTLVKSFMEEAKFGRPINTVVAKQAVASCVDSILKSPDNLTLMAMLKNRDEYTAQHSMNVCIFAVALGRQMHLNREQLNNLGLCGMMHDMGKMVIPPEILNKPGRLTDDEMRIMESHTEQGRRILIDSRDMYSGAIDVAHMHHERMNGTGYPRKLTGEHITPFAQMVAVVDVYDAITSDRPYKKGKSHLDAIKILTDISTEGHLNSQLSMKFIACLGIYPAGSLVELISGEVGLVLHANPKARLKPTILILRDANKQPCNEYLVDLSMVSENQGGEAFRIKQLLNSDEYGVDLFKYYEKGLLTF
jgi:HD-GYP domain-containing protein (c-di-GMP phosphodiesterase class II)